MELYKKAKYVTERLTFYGRMLANDVEDIFKDRIDTAEKAKELLKTSAKVDDMYRIEDAVHGVYYANGKFKTFMSPSEYTLYDVGPLTTKLYYFNGQKDDFIKDEDIITLYNVIKDLDTKIPEIYCLRVMGKYQFYFKVHEGKNGTGDFVDDDMKNVVKILDKMKESGATWRCITDVSIDMPDDVSTWVITFTIE